ncbi:response regulator transcription factor [Synechococcus moorigangaii CMS01]|nr:response regulator transcription factor [Synechococcus moorigangaii CMS01]
MKRILVVDDDPILQKILETLLQQAGYLVELALSGEAALEQWPIFQPDLIVSDVRMPGIDGFELCRRIRAEPPGQLLPFLFLSSQTDLDNRLEGHLSGADDYVTKPFEMKELLVKIDRQLARTETIHQEIQRLTLQGAVEEKPLPKPLPLTPAEMRVFWEVVQGWTNKQISEHLYVSPRTVQTHLSSILHKLGLENRSQLVRFAYENGYEKPADISQEEE